MMLNFIQYLARNLEGFIIGHSPVINVCWKKLIIYLVFHPSSLEYECLD